MELYADHQALKKFTQRLMQARESYSQKLREIGKGLPQLLSSGILYILFQAGDTLLVVSLNQK